MKSLTQVLTIASLLVVLIAVASAFVPLEDDDLAAAQEMYMEYPELAQFFPGKKENSARQQIIPLIAYPPWSPIT